MDVWEVDLPSWLFLKAMKSKLWVILFSSQQSTSSKCLKQHVEALTETFVEMTLEERSFRVIGFSCIQTDIVRSGQIRSMTCYRYHVNLHEPVPGSGCRWLNHLPHLVSWWGGCMIWTPSSMKNKTCQRAEELLSSQWPSISSAQLCLWTFSCSWVIFIWGGWWQDLHSDHRKNHSFHKTYKKH